MGNLDTGTSGRSFIMEGPSAVPEEKPLPPRPANEFDTLLDIQEKQVLFLCETMRRLEDLADRIGGVQPAGGSTEAQPNPGDGYLGALHRQNLDRQGIAARLSEAMTRIEQLI